jgi:hypothetical protein
MISRLNPDLCVGARGTTQEDKSDNRLHSICGESQPGDDDDGEMINSCYFEWLRETNRVQQMGQLRQRQQGRKHGIIR